jgi:hypothetical protein
MLLTIVLDGGCRHFGLVCCSDSGFGLLFLTELFDQLVGATEVAKLRPEWSYWGIVSRPVSFHFFGFYLYIDVLCFTMNHFLFCRHDSEANAHAKFFGSSDKKF